MTLVTMVEKLDREADEINVKLTDKQINELLSQPERETKQRGYTGFSIGIISVELNPMDLLKKRVKITVSLCGIPVGDVILDTGSLSQSIGANIGIAKAFITLTVDWDGRKIQIAAKACVRKWLKWICSNYNSTVTTW